MAGVGPQDLHELAEELLAASIAALDTVPVAIPGLEGAPERSMVTYADPVADCCPQLTVHTGPITEAPTSPQGLPIERRAGIHIRINHVGLFVTLFRCVPVPDPNLADYEPPAVEAIEAAAEQLNADGWALWNHLFNRVDAGLLLSRCGGIIPEVLRPIPGSGGCAGWIGSFRVKLDGYEEDIS